MALIRRILDLSGAQCTADEFAAEWRAGVSELAMLLRQGEQGAAVRAKLVKSLQSMVPRLSALLLFQSELCLAFVCRGLDGGNGGGGAPAQAAVWDRTAESLRLTGEQAATMSLMAELFLAFFADTERRRHAAAQLALSDPGDLCLQEGAVSGLEAAQAVYVVQVVAYWVVIITSLLSPEQVAEILVQSWPHVPPLGGILDSCARVYAPYAHRPC
ncbi:MAG: hypothetical protein J3K34DRAFT_412191 [Monoraphidium minutum]|nr:MAG: hypothetical protein J3K34DRAFT_412191 [Monoraphidium minutum]